MPRQNSLDIMFKLNPEGLDLTGFTSSSFLNKIMYSLGREKLLEGSVKLDRQGRKFVNLSFDPEYISDRQRFFSKLYSPSRIRKNLFDMRFPGAGEDLRVYSSDESFFGLCEDIEETLDEVKRELGDFRYLPPARRILSKIDMFNGTYKKMFDFLKDFDDIQTFAVDVRTGEIAPISHMPKENRIFVPREGEQGRDHFDYDVADEIRVRMKSQAMKLAKEGGSKLRKRLVDFVRDEFRVVEGKRNLRSDFEELAFPVRLYGEYEEFLNWCQRYNKRLFREIEGGDDNGMGVEGFLAPDDVDRAQLEKMSWQYFNRGGGLMFEPVYSQFGDSFDIKGLFPPTLKGELLSEGFAPIDFKTQPGKRHILIAGLHSGGKSFLLDNLVLTSIFGQVGFSLPAELIKLPYFERIFYHKSIESSGGEDKGKWETEVGKINEIINLAGERDLVVLDELLDSTEGDIAVPLVPDILYKLRKLKSHVIVTTHRATDYQQLEIDGWRLMTPGYKLVNNRVIPTRTLSDGAPNREINTKYAMDTYGDLLKKKRR